MPNCTQLQIIFVIHRGYQMTVVSFLIKFNEFNKFSNKPKGMYIVFIVYRQKELSIVKKSPDKSLMQR